MRHPKPSPFFQRRLAPGEEVAARLSASHRRRVMLATAVTVGVLLLTVSAVIYLAHPERFQRPRWKPSPAGEDRDVRTTEIAPGVYRVEVREGSRQQAYQVRRVGEEWAIENVTPPEPRPPWWQRWWKWLKNAMG